MRTHFCAPLLRAPLMGLLLALTAAHANAHHVWIEDAAYPSFAARMADKPGARGIYVPAARLITGFAKHEPRLTLDLVPTGPAAQVSLELQAFYKGQQLPKAKVEVIAASGWGKEHHTDAEGKIKVTLPWQGTYVLEISHNDSAGGERGGERYERASHLTSLTLAQPEGLPALPAPPAAAPNKAD